MKQHPMRRLILGCAALLALLPFAAQAQWAVNASGTGHLEENSNVFDLQSGFPVPGTNDFRHSDTIYGVMGALDAKYRWAAQQFFADLSADDFKYQHFSQIDHTDYKFDVGWKGKFDQALDGAFDVLRTRSMVPFTDLSVSTLSLLTEQRETAKIGYLFLQDWRFDASGFQRTVEEPLPQAPDLRLAESSATATLNYVGNPGWTSGLNVGYLTGRFTGVGGTDSPSYHQVQFGGSTNYELSGRSTLAASGGYSRRTSADGSDNISGFIGQLDFKRQLTGKTSVDLQLGRAINAYISNVGSEIDTSAGVLVDWAATYRLDVQAAYSWTYRDFPGQGNDPPGSTRKDHQQLSSLRLDYHPLLWLAIKPYITLQSRTSDFISGNFNATGFGIDIVVQYKSR
jgi:Putative beta-barrel porin 2